MIGSLDIVVHFNVGAEILNADEEIIVSGRLWEQMQQGEKASYVQVQDNQFTVYGIDRIVTYEVGEYDSAQDRWTFHKTLDESKNPLSELRAHT